MTSGGKRCRKVDRGGCLANTPFLVGDGDDDRRIIRVERRGLAGDVAPLEYSHPALYDSGGV